LSNDVILGENFKWLNIRVSLYFAFYTCYTK